MLRPQKLSVLYALDCCGVRIRSQRSLSTLLTVSELVVVGALSGEATRDRHRRRCCKHGFRSWFENLKQVGGFISDVSEFSEFSEFSYQFRTARGLYWRSGVPSTFAGCTKRGRLSIAHPPLPDQHLQWVLAPPSIPCLAGRLFPQVLSAPVESEAVFGRPPPPTKI